VTLPARFLSLEFADTEHDVFFLNNESAPMPYALLPGDRPLLDAARALPELKAGSVALRFGTFWVFWDNLRAEIDLDELTEMYEGCYQLLDSGVWQFQGAS
jgi:hypothetical protein